MHATDPAATTGPYVLRPAAGEVPGPRREPADMPTSAGPYAREDADGTARVDQYFEEYFFE